QVRCRLEALLRVLFQTAMHHPLHGLWNICDDLRNPRRVLVQDRAHRVRRSRLLERSFPRQHFIQNRAEGKNVGPRTDAIARCWLESASSTANSFSGGILSNSFGSGSFCPAVISLFAPTSPAIAAITECVANSFACSCRSFTIAIF